MTVSDPTFTSTINPTDQNLTVHGFSHAKVCQIGKWSQVQSGGILIAITLITILAAYLFSFVPGLGGFTSLAGGAVLLGVLWVTAVPAVKKYYFKQDVEKYLKDNADAIQGLIDAATDNKITLPEGHPRSMRSEVNIGLDGALEIHASKGTFLVRVGEFLIKLGTAFDQEQAKTVEV